MLYVVSGLNAGTDRRSTGLLARHLNNPNLEHSMHEPKTGGHDSRDTRHKQDLARGVDKQAHIEGSSPGRGAIKSSIARERAADWGEYSGEYSFTFFTKCPYLLLSFQEDSRSASDGSGNPSSTLPQRSLSLQIIEIDWVSAQSMCSRVVRCRRRLPRSRSTASGTAMAASCRILRFGTPSTTRLPST